MSRRMPNKKTVFAVQNFEPAGSHCTLAEAAAYARCSIDTVRRWITAKRLIAHRTVKRGSSRYRVDVTSLRQLLNESDD